MIHSHSKTKHKENLLTASITEKGQVTIPKSVRTLLKLHEHDLIGFRVSHGKVEIVPVEVTASNYSFSDEEWRKIDKISRQRGKIFNSAEEAKEYARSL